MGGHPDVQQYLAVSCQNCGEMIPVPVHVLDRQIVLAEDPSDLGHRYVSTLLNLRCRACHREYFYDVKEVMQVEGMPRSFADGMRRHHRRTVAPAHEHHHLTHA
jgi:hypothetical protein